MLREAEKILEKYQEQPQLLDPALEETTTQMCWACREPLTEEEMESEQYEIANYCPYCIEDTRTLQGAP